MTSFKYLTWGPVFFNTRTDLEKVGRDLLQILDLQFDLGSSVLQHSHCVIVCRIPTQKDCFVTSKVQKKVGYYRHTRANICAYNTRTRWYPYGTLFLVFYMTEKYRCVSGNLYHGICCYYTGLVPNDFITFKNIPRFCSMRGASRLTIVTPVEE